MTDFFLQLIDLSKIISIMIVTVILLRFVLRRAPRRVHKILWIIVGIRSSLPFYIKSSLGILPSESAQLTITGSGIVRTEPFQGVILADAVQQVPAVTSTAIDIKSIIAFVWIVGTAVFLAYFALNYLKTKRAVSGAKCIENDIYVSDRIPSPFILGYIRPRIYVLPDMDKGQEELIVAHERCHLKNMDHVLKLIGFVLLGVYWFNPLMWIAYVLFCKDVELACDEEVISELPFVQRKEYAIALLNSAHNSSRLSYGLAFSENNVKERVVSVMNYKKPKFIIIITAAVACCAVLFAFFTVNKANGQSSYITYEFETFEGVTVVINESNIVSQEKVDDVLETDKVPVDAEVIAPGRDYVYLSDANYYYVEDAANGLLTVAIIDGKAKEVAAASEGASAVYEGDSFSFQYNPDTMYLFEDEMGVTLSYYREDIDLAGSNVITFSIADGGSSEDVIEDKVTTYGGDTADIREIDINSGVEQAYVYSAYGESPDSELKTAQIYYAMQAGDTVVLADEFRTIGTDEDLELEIDSEFGHVMQSLAVK